MKLTDIKSEEDVSRFIEGTINDYRDGIATKVQTEILIHRLIIYLIKLDRKKRGNV